MEKREKLSTGQILMANFLSSLTSGVIIIVVNMLSPLFPLVYYLEHLCITSFFISFSIKSFFISIFFTKLGYENGLNIKIQIGMYIIKSIPSIILYIIGSFIRLFIVFIPYATNSTMILGYIFMGRCFSTIPDVGTVNKYYIGLIFSVLFHICFIILSSYLFYRKGMKKRILFRNIVLSGEDIIKPKVSLTRRLLFIPIFNLISFFCWVYKYYSYTEYKLRSFFKKTLLIGTIYFSISILFEWLNSKFEFDISNSIGIIIIIHTIRLYLIGIFISLIIISDEKKHNKD